MNYNYKNIKIQTQTTMSFYSSDTQYRKVLTPHEQLELKNVIIKLLLELSIIADYIGQYISSREDLLKTIKEERRSSVIYYFDLLCAYCWDLDLDVYPYSSDEFLNQNGVGFETWSSMILEDLDKLQFNSIEPEEEEYSKHIPSRHLSHTKAMEKIRHEINLQKKKECNQHDHGSGNLQERRKPKYNSRYHKNRTLVEDVSVC
jgi:hypothetical protein